MAGSAYWGVQQYVAVLAYSVACWRIRQQRVSSSWTLSRGTRALRKTTTTPGSMSFRSTGINSTQWQREKHGEPGSRAVHWWGHSETKTRDESSQFRLSPFRLQVRVETGTDRHRLSSTLSLHSPHCRDKVSTRRNTGLIGTDLNSEQNGVVFQVSG